jgi:hypothetical protein
MARRRAINARGEADAGRALAKAIKALPDPTAATRDLAQQPGEAGSAASHLLVLKRIAEELFPSEAVVEETRPASPNGR